MDNLIKLNLKLPNGKFGSSKYTIQLEITNVSNGKIYFDEINADIVPGVIISKNLTNSISELTLLELEKKEIIEEMEFQLTTAYSKKKYSELDFLTKLFIAYASLPEIIAASIMKTKPELKFPFWAKKAFSIKDWNDVLQLEETIMHFEKDNSLLKKAFIINKSKLENVILELSKVREHSGDDLRYSYSLNPKETTIIPYHCRAPHLYKETNFEVLFNFKFRISESQNIFNQAISDTIIFKTSSFAVPLGASIGGVLGFLIKLIFVTKGNFFDYNFWTVLLGSILISLVLGFITNSSTESKKIISVEGFVGGLIIGTIASLFTEKIIQYFEKFIPV